MPLYIYGCPYANAPVYMPTSNADAHAYGRNAPMPLYAPAYVWVWARVIHAHAGKTEPRLSLIYT